VGFEITQASPARSSAIASVLGRAFVAEPMKRWPLGEHGDVEERFTGAFGYYIDGLIRLGMVWEAGDALGALIWVPPDEMDVWHEAQMNNAAVHELTDDGGLRHARFWDWVESKVPAEPIAHLDAVGVEPAAQGRGVGSALIVFGLDRARDSGHSVFLETGSPRNVPLYERHGFDVVEDADAPDGGPHIWFMRWDP